MSFGPNLLWFVCGGWLSALFWFVLGVISCCTVVGVPYGKAAFRIANMIAWPFGREIIDARKMGGKRIVGTGLANLVWIVCLGLWLALAHAIIGLFLCITVVGIPFGLQHFKFAQLGFAPLGKKIVSKHAARVAHEEEAREAIRRSKEG